jgi:protein associated with RNAse G/E
MIKLGKVIKIRALKFPDILHYEWEGELLRHTADYVLVLCQPGRKLIHHTKNKVFIVNNTSLEFFFLKEWFTVAMEVEDGNVVSAYCNVAKPSVLINDEISFIDLDLDYIREKNKEWEVVDEDEFESNSIKYKYPVELKNEAVKALARLKEEVRKGNFPFNNQVASQLDIF